jgi:hypothetical protein
MEIIIQLYDVILTEALKGNFSWFILIVNALQLLVMLVNIYVLLHKKA